MASKTSDEGWVDLPLPSPEPVGGDLEAGAAAEADAGWIDLPPRFEGKGDDVLVNEAHPAIDRNHRLFIQNFLSGDPETAVGVLKKLYRQDLYEAKVVDGKPALRIRGEPVFRKVEEEGIPRSAEEAISDVGDIGYDLASALGEAGAGAAGFAVGGPIGAAGAAGLTSAAADQLKQRIIAASGGPEPSWAQTGIAATIGGMLPALGGTGITAAQAEKIAAKEGLPGWLGTLSEKLRGYVPTAEELQKSAGGVLGDTIDYLKANLLPKVASLTTGIPEDTISHAAANIGKFSGKQAVTPEVEAAQGVLTDTLFNAQTKVGKQLEAAYDAIPAVNIAEAKQELMNARALVEKDLGEAGTPALQAELEEIDNTIAQFFPEGMPDTVSGGYAFRLKRRLDDLAEARNITGSSVGRFTGKPVSDLNIKLASDRARRSLQGQLDQASDGLTRKLRDDYAGIKELQGRFEKYTKDPEAADTKFRATLKKGRVGLERFEKFDKDYGTDVVARIRDLDAQEVFGQPDWIYKGAQTGANLLRSTPGAVGGGLIGGYVGNQNRGEGGGPANAYIGGVLGGGLGWLLTNPKALKQYMLLNRNLGFMKEQAKELGLRPQAGWQYLKQQEAERYGNQNQP